MKRKVELGVQFADQVVLFGGVRELLDALYGKVRIGLASMNNQDVIKRLLQLNELEKYFEVVLTAEMVSKSKPTRNFP